MDKKYEFTGETKDWNGHTIRRIRAVKTVANVATGELGGWIEKEENLSQDGDAWVSDNAWVFGDAWVYGDAWVSDNARVYGNARVSGDARVYGNARVSGDAKVYGNAKVSGYAKVYGNAKVSGYAWVFGDAWVFGNAEVYGDAKVFGDAWVYGNAEVYGGAKVYGDADYMVFKNCWSSGRFFTYTRSNKKWKVGCFYGTGEELIKKAYADSEISGRCYEAIVKAVETIEKAKGEMK